MMSFKFFIATFMITGSVALGSFAGFNYFVDPMWTFDHEHEYNDVQTVIDERQQKVNHIYYSDFDYDTLLVGSSRSTYINQHAFSGMDVYNFSASDLSFKEYPSIINFAKSENERDFERIVIGVDFFKSAVSQSSEDMNLDEYITTVEEPFYRWKMLLSEDVYDYAKKNYRLSNEDEIVELRNYNRDNVASAKDFPEDVKQQQTKDKIAKFKSQFYGDEFEYNPEFKDVMQVVESSNPESEVVVFTTPISAELFSALVEEGNLDEYETWLRDMVAVHGEIYNFMYPNSVTKDMSNYFDGHHFYPHVGDLIAERISKGEDATGVPEDFGVLVTEENINEHIAWIESLVE
ncbi:hypothetical protein [Tenuibacillus multivorans]|nr:hypothetical protein [Tenuibacillus multivorans]GEL78648.1 hypothetical protein TMU01_28830 [Tenuibacillus multivorans]